MKSLLNALRRRDPGLRVVRRAARVTAAACAGFYLCRYVVGLPVLATYALFGSVALGVLSQVSGRPTQRARTLLAVLPVAWALVAAGTLLAASNVAAALGMFVLGFVVTYAAVGGPQLVGLANGLQLLYILPCFPPYDPHSLWQRLAGVSVGIVALAIAEVTLWPDPAPTPYRRVLADAVASLGTALSAAAQWVAGDPAGRGTLLEQVPAARAAISALRPSALDPTERPASASRTSRAYAQAGGSVRYLAGRVAELADDDPTDQVGLPAAAALLHACAQATSSAQRWLRGTGPAPELSGLRTAMGRFRQARVGLDPVGVHPNRLRRGAQVLAMADGVAALLTSVRIAAGLPIGADPASTAPTTGASRTGPFWYAYEPAPALWWRRFRLHLTPRSVYFQGALRLALALAVARLLAGAFELSHGFWVLLAILTTMRASAAQTRRLLWPALGGTLIGAVAAAGLLLVVNQQHVYEFALPALMLCGFAAGPLIGQLWGQVLFTLVLATVFAQVGPRDWHLAEARVVDVVAGAAIGVLVGFVAWPRGGAGELRRAAGNLLGACSTVVTETIQVITIGGAPGEALPTARRRDEFADASYALYQSEPRDGQASGVDWQATLIAARHAMGGAEALLHTRPTHPLTGCFRPLRAESQGVADAYREAGRRLVAGAPAVVGSGRVEADQWPTDLGHDLYHLADMRVWLDGLDDDLTRLAAPA